MPGTIQVSVLELVDLPLPPPPCPSEANSSFVSLKVVMGKREYQSVGGGDFSFPVISLRENLILMLHDMDGNLISQTEFKTSLVVEKGIWDDVFPLEGGGSVHMKLQFVLSDEERQRIREMRFSALKRKHMELLKGGCETPVSELNAEGDGIGRLKQIDPGVPDFAGVDEGKNKTQAAPGGIGRQFSACEGLDPYIGCLGSPISGNVTKDSISVSAESDDHICSPKRKNLQERGSSSSVRKMISAFENSLFQGTGHHVGRGTTSQLSKIESGGYMKRISSEERDITKLKFPQTMAKSFSAEMLSEIDSQCDPMFIKSPFVKKQEGVQYFNNATRQEMIRKNSPFRNLAVNQNFKSFKPDKRKSVGAANDGSPSLESLHTAQSHNSKNIDTVSGPVMTENVVSFGGSAEHIGKRKDPVSIEKKINMPNECHSLITCTVQKFPGERSLIYNGEKLKALGTRQKPFETEQIASLGRSVRNVTEREDSLAGEVGKSPSIISKHRKSSAFEQTPKVNTFLKQVHSLDAHTAARTSGEMSLSHGGVELEALGARDYTTNERNPREEKTNDDSEITKQNVSDHLLPYDELIFLHKSDVSQDMDQPSSLCTYNQGSGLNARTNESDWRCYRSHVEERIISGNSEFLELLSSYREKCLFGKVDVWERHHLCITTGNKQLRNLVESCSSCLGTLPSEKNLFTVEANKKQKMHLAVTGNEKFSCSSEKSNHENKVSNSNFNGMLIEQLADSFMKSPTRMSNIISEYELLL